MKKQRVSYEKITVNDLINLRKAQWERLRSIKDDDVLVNSIAQSILRYKNLKNEVLSCPHLLIEACFTIVNKNKECVPFFLNEVQKDFVKKLSTLDKSKPFFVLKGRQQGFTTLITAIQLSYAITTQNFAGFTVADRDDNTKAIFVDKAKTIYNRLPEILKPQERFNSTNELFFERLNSSWRVSAASSNIGRSRTLSFIHFSEAAFYKCPLADLQKSIVEAACPGAIIIYETTANGFNDAKALWDSGACHNLFYEWYKSSEYCVNDLSYLKNADTWLKKRLSELKKLGLCDGQRAWYAKKYCSYIDKSSIKQEYPCSAHEAFLSSGSCIFNKEALSEMISSFDIKSQLGYFEYDKVATNVCDSLGRLLYTKYEIKNVRFVKSSDGYISIVEEPHHVQNGSRLEKKPYVIGADTAGEGKDFFTAKVIDNTNGRVVCTLRRQYIDEDLFAEQLYCLGRYYNNALIGIEINFSRGPVRHLCALGYENLYRQQSFTENGAERENRFGFLTTCVSRPIIISNLVTVMRESPQLETDLETLKEMTTFVRRKDGKQAACDGAHDDLVMCCAIARFIGIDYEHNMQIIDTSSAFLLSSFKNSDQCQGTYMEW